MTILTEGRHVGEFILSEGDAGYSRDNAIVASGAGVITPGTILAKVTASGKYVPSPATGSDGSQTAIAVAIGGCDATSADAKVAVISRAAQVKAVALTYESTVNDGTKKAAKHTQLAAVGIIVR